MHTHYLVYGVFLSQLLLISYYYPKQIGQRIKQLLQNYPASQYPKLYPNSEAKFGAGNTVFQWLNVTMLLLGAVILALLVYLLEQNIKTAAQLSFLPLIFGLLQAIPYGYLELSNNKQLKVMREANTQTKRQAELAPRNLFSFISPTKVACAAVLFVVCVLSLLYFAQFTLSFDLMVLLGAMLLSNGLFVAITIKLLYGKKLDPYQSASDRARVIRANLQSFVYTSILISVFFILNKSVDAFNWHQAEIIFNSLFWLLVMTFSTGSLLSGSRLSDINFDVYRA